MAFFRDDCASLQQRQSGLACVCARVVEVNPLKVQDESGTVHIDNKSGTELQIGDYAYFLFDTKVRPLVCGRLTPIPPELYPVALYQLNVSRQSIESKDGSSVGS
jgi:hypothetical protein